MSGRRNAALAAAGAVLAAGVAGGVAAQRRAVGRARSAPDPYADEPFGRVHSRSRTVVAEDGTRLHVEVAGEPDAVLSVVFVHGFVLSLDCWHFQRRDLADVGRLVFFDQRSHGASARGPRESATIDQLGRDLAAVLTDVAPTGPVVLVGHSMGGMSILALADQQPQLFAERVVAAALLSTSAGPFAETTLGIPGFVGRALRPVAPGVIRQANRRASLLERGRRAGTDLAFMLTRFYSFGPDAPPSLVAFMERMVAATPVEVMTEFFDTFLSHDKLDAVDVLRDIPVLVACGDRDRLTPVRHSVAIADALPHAELLVLAGAGHMAILDRHDEVDAALRRLLDRAAHRIRARA